MRSKYILIIFSFIFPLFLTGCYWGCNRMGPNDCFGDADCWRVSQACGSCNVCNYSPLPNACNRCCGDNFYISQ